MEHPVISGQERDWSAPDRDVVYLDEARATRVFEALTCPTRREILVYLWEEPSSSSELAERLDCSVQNTQYHLDTLVDSHLVEVVDTTLSTRGYEMDLYAPVRAPVVVVAPPESTDRRSAGRRAAIAGDSSRASQSGLVPVATVDSD
jgi:hypothetical protein